MNIRVQIHHLNPQRAVIIRQLLGHTLGEGRDQDACLPLDALANFIQQIVHLPGRRAHIDHRIHQTGGPNNLLHDNAAAHLQFIVRRRGRDIEDLVHPVAKLVKIERPVIHGRGQPEAVIHQVLLARAVAVIHAVELRHCNMALVDEQQVVGRKIIQQRRRRLPGLAAIQMARVILNAGAHPGGEQHFEIIPRALLQALRFKEFILAL